MNDCQTESTALPDPAAVFGTALSLWKNCQAQAEKNSSLNLSEAYQGCDQLMREMMRIGYLFEEWACAHVAFEELEEVWPYLLEVQFGAACLKHCGADSLAHFGQNECLLVAMALKLPVRANEGLRLPVDVRARNPITDSYFHELRIQTMRHHEEDHEWVPFLPGDEPFDPDFIALHFSLYGVDENGMSEHIADRSSYATAYELATKLTPGIALPISPTIRLSPLVASYNK